MTGSAEVHAEALGATVQTGPSVDDADSLRRQREEAETALEGAQAKVDKIRDHLKGAEQAVRDARAALKEARRREKGDD